MQKCVKSPFELIRYYSEKSTNTTPTKQKLKVYDCKRLEQCHLSMCLL